MANANLTSKQKREISRLEQMNEAEQIVYAQAHMDRPFKHLKADSFHERRGFIAVFAEPEIAESGGGFTCGDRVVMTSKGRVNAALCGDRTEGVVQGVLMKGQQLKVNGLIYAAQLWKKSS